MMLGAYGPTHRPAMKSVSKKVRKTPTLQGIQGSSLSKKKLERKIISLFFSVLKTTSISALKYRVFKGHRGFPFHLRG